MILKFFYFLLIIAAAYYGCFTYEWDRACFDLLLAYGLRLNIKEAEESNN